MNPLVNALIGPVFEILSKVIPDKDEARRLSHEIATKTADQAHEINQGQISTNRIEAASRFLFIAGWRPFIGWTCGVAMANNYLVVPYIETARALDLNTMMPVLMGMLGLGGMRSWEKAKGVAREK